MKKLALLAFTLLSAWNMDAKTITGPVDYVSPLVGTQSKHALSTGNTYPAIALPWGMNFWVPQTGKMGDGWTYTDDADKIRGFKQTHQPSPWINDYGQFAIMPITGKVVFDQDQRASWFSHKAETATPYYYKVDGIMEAYIRMGNESVIAPSYVLNQLILKGMHRPMTS